MSQYRDPEQYRAEKHTGDTVESLFDAVERAERNATVIPAPPRDPVDVAWEHLMSGTCVCGGKKQVKRSFCRFCYWELPRKMRTALWTPMPEYAAEYEKSRQWLTARLAEKAATRKR
jgi:hypothetical protein